MDITNTQSVAIDFAAYSYELSIPILPAANQNDDGEGKIKDVLIAFTSGSGSFPNTAIGKAANDLHFFADRVDITASLKHVVLLGLKSLAADELRGAYFTGLEAWLKLVEGLGDAFPGSLGEEEAVQSSILSSLAGDPIPEESLQSLIDRLGDTDDMTRWGWGGNQHVLNYLFTSISLPPISITEVLDHHNTTNPPILLSEIGAMHVSQSAKRMGSPAWTPLPPPSGRLSVNIQSSYENPLDGKIAELERRLDALTEDYNKLKLFIRNRLTNIFDAVKTDGPIQGTLGTINSNLQLAESTLGQAKSEISSHSVQLDTVSSDVSDLADKIDAL